jgi:RHS repeat-associated protein
LKSWIHDLLPGHDTRSVWRSSELGTTTFAYRGDGLRASRTAGGVTTNFTWDINAGLPVVLDDGAQYLYGAGLEAMKQSGNWFYYLADGLGSTMAIVNASGTVQNSYAYDVYGKPTVTGSLANEHDFAGQQTDATGLQYLRARYMDPETGTFASREPLAARPGWVQSETAYVGGNPANMTDRTGLCADGSPECEGASSSVGGGACSNYTFSLGGVGGVCANGDWNRGAVAIAEILNNTIAKAKNSRFRGNEGDVEHCTDVGKKSKSRTIGMGNGEYASSCNRVFPTDIDPRISCVAETIVLQDGSGGAGAIDTLECVNQFGATVARAANVSDMTMFQDAIVGCFTGGAIEGGVEAAIERVLQRGSKVKFNPIGLAAGCLVGAGTTLLP